MPKFTQQELEEIQQNTERIEIERRKKELLSKQGKQSSSEDQTQTSSSKSDSKKTSKSGKNSKKSSRSKSVSRSKRKKGDHSVRERLVALFLLLLTIVISYLVMEMNS